ncbi:MAG: prepilin-type N-terminal cleavage/methylation domain-containing protein [Candidatus Gracilibacteria bacterium]|nr:prepilin-type N-terminal cleavage/methylation domain-containing protein [Candidatus Gracilibacteria bacterium]
MKKKKIAFTMIELMVVVSIISIISITSINGFFGFLQNKDLKIKMNYISNNVLDEDKKIKNNEIYDYDLLINTSVNDAYTIYENIYDNNQYINLIYSNNIGNLNLIGLSGEMWKLLIYKGEKLKNKIDIPINTYNNIGIENNYDYRFVSVLSGSTNITDLNSIDLIKFDKEENKLVLTKISKTIGGSDIGNLEIKNIGGKKEFYNSGAILNQDEIYLYFESSGVENYLKLTK